jgi:hypothetical protein
MIRFLINAVCLRLQRDEDRHSTGSGEVRSGDFREMESVSNSIDEYRKLLSD